MVWPIMRQTAASLVLAMGLLTPARLIALQEKKPVPDTATQKEVENLIRDVFRDDYAGKSPDARAALAKKLLREGIGTQDDAPTRYVLLREARDIAARAGDAESALEAIDAMDRGFRIDALALKFDALAKAGKKARAPSEHGVLAGFYLKLVEEAVGAEDFAAAAKAGKFAVSFARRSKNMSRVARAKAKQTAVALMKKEFEAIKKARAQLISEPDNAAANLVMGRFLCLSKGDWESGLPHFLKCSDPAFRDLAVSDFNTPDDASEQMAVGDGWWGLSKKEKGIARKNLRQRAGHWYQRAVAGLTGLKKTKTLKRLEEVSAERLGGTWIDVTEPARFGLGGGKGDPIRVDAKLGEGTLVKMEQWPKGEYDAVSVTIRFEPSGPGHAVVIFEPEARCVILDTGNDKFMVAHQEKEWVHDVDEKRPIGRQHIVTVQVMDLKYIVFLDGKKVATVDTDQRRLRGLNLQASHGPVTFERIRLRKKEK